MFSKFLSCQPISLRATIFSRGIHNTKRRPSRLSNPVRDRRCSLFQVRSIRICVSRRLCLPDDPQADCVWIRSAMCRTGKAMRDSQFRLSIASYACFPFVDCLLRGLNNKIDRWIVDTGAATGRPRRQARFQSAISDGNKLNCRAQKKIHFMSDPPFSRSVRNVFTLIIEEGDG